MTAPMWWRKNLHDNDGDGTYTSNNDGVDINRNFGFKWGYNSEGSSPLLTAWDYRGLEAFSEPETKAFRQFIIQHEFLISVNLHSSGQYIFYPWGYRADIETEHHAALMTLADSCAAYNGYRAEMASMLYPVNGGADDWLYGDVSAKKRVFPFTFEVGNVEESLDPGGFYPKPEFFEKQITDNIKPLLFMADAAGQMPAINVIPIPDYEDPQLSYETRIQLIPAVELTDPIQLDENGLWVYFKKTDTAPFDSVRLEKTENQDEYSGTISGLGDANSVFYFYKITDSRGLTRQAPRTAPKKLFVYTIKPDTVPPVVSSEPIPDIPFTTEHIEFYVKAEDNVGIDRVLAHIRLNGRAIESFEMMAVDTTEYKHVWGYSAFGVGDIIEYYFEVWDAAKKQNYTRFPEIDYFQICVANQQLFDLEGNWGFIAQASGDWQHGTPTSGPGGANSGESVWATNLSGNYTKNTKSSLITQSIDLKNTRQARVTFWQWFSFEAENTAHPINGYDGGNILISVDNGPFVIIEPENGYNMTFFSGASGYDHEPVFSGQHTGNFWHQCTLNLTENVGHQVRLRFDATSDQQFTCPGWYLDDFKLILSSNMPPMLTNVTRMPKQTPNNGPTLISATVIDDRTVMDVKLHYITDRISEFRQVKMETEGGADNPYHAEIPKQKLETYVKYYLTAIDSDGLTTFWPTGAPKKCIGFEITGDLPQIDIVFDLILNSDSPQLPDTNTLLIMNNGQQPLMCTISETLFTVSGDTEFDQIGARSGMVARPVKLFSVFPRQFTLDPADTICVSVKRAALAATDNYSGALLLKSND
ncbi:hypothetical protein KAH55_12370, partial [bacterium]|nr:hypothetical protein [bacterium]